MGCEGCIIILLSLLMPRVVILMIAIFTEYMLIAYETAIWPVLGWLFMPFTTLSYCAAMVNNDHQVTGGWLILMIVAVVIDLGINGNAANNGEGCDWTPT